MEITKRDVIAGGVATAVVGTSLGAAATIAIPKMGITAGEARVFGKIGMTALAPFAIPVALAATRPDDMGTGALIGGAAGAVAFGGTAASWGLRGQALGFVTAGAAALGGIAGAITGAKID